LPLHRFHKTHQVIIYHRSGPELFRGSYDDVSRVRAGMIDAGISVSGIATVSPVPTYCVEILTDKGWEIGKETHSQEDAADYVARSFADGYDVRTTVEHRIEKGQ